MQIKTCITFKMQYNYNNKSFKKANMQYKEYTENKINKI